MTTASGGAPPAHDHPLGPIKGIGPTRQLLLQDLLHIRTVQDLAAADPAIIETSLRGAGQTVTRSKVADWVAQARQLAAALDREQEAETDSSEEQTPEEEQTTDQLLPTSASGEFTDLQPETANLAEADLAPKAPGVNVDLPDLPTPATEAITLEVYRVVVVQPPGTGILQVVTERDRSLPGSILAHQPFQLTLNFGLKGLTGLAISAQASYSLQGFAKSLSYRHHGIAVGESHICFLAGHGPLFSASITAAGLPLGLYRLQVIIAFKDIPIPFSIHEIPRFQVV